MPMDFVDSNLCACERRFGDCAAFWNVVPKKVARFVVDTLRMLDRWGSFSLGPLCSLADWFNMTTHLQHLRCFVRHRIGIHLERLLQNGELNEQQDAHLRSIIPV